MRTFNVKKKLTKKYGKDILKRSAINLKNGAEDIKYFMRKNNIKTAIEIGTFRGVTSIEMSKHCDKLITIDLKNGQIEDYKKKFEWADTPYRQEIWDYCKVDNIELVTIESEQDKIEFLKNTEFDFIFIDGLHTFEAVKNDFELSKKCGRVLFHDYDRAPNKEAPVRDFIDTLDQSKLETTKDFAYWEDISE
jgi:predicted O-methyltransferase YrrM